jgi:hypothetical protein
MPTPRYLFLDRSDPAIIHPSPPHRQLEARLEVVNPIGQCPLWVISRHSSSADVRYSPKSGHWSFRCECPLCAKSTLMHRSKNVAIPSAQLNELGHPGRLKALVMQSL